MDEKAGKNDRVLIVAAALLAVVVGFFLGRGTAPTSASTDEGTAQSIAAQSVDGEEAPDSSATKTDGYVVSEEARARANRSELEKLQLVDGPIYVTGHKSPDADTVCSSIAYANLLTKLGYDARPVVLGDINNETAFILNDAGVEVPELLEDASGLNMVLVDHSEYEQSAEGLKDANVVTIIDHHGDGAVTTSNQLVYDARPLGSTCTIVWMRYLNYDVKFDEQMAKVMLGGLLSDTMGLKSNVTAADEEASRDLTDAAGVTDLDAFYNSIYKASISHEGQTDEQIFNSDLKTYDAGGHRYAIGVVSVYNEDEAKDMAERMKAVMPTQQKELGVEYAFSQISVYHDDVNLNYLVPADEASKEVLDAAYGDTASFDGTSYRLEPGISRKAKLVPDIDAVLTSSPSE